MFKIVHKHKVTQRNHLEVTVCANSTTNTQASTKVNKRHFRLTQVLRTHLGRQLQQEQ